MVKKAANLKNYLLSLDSLNGGVNTSLSVGSFSKPRQSILANQFLMRFAADI